MTECWTTPEKALEAGERLFWTVEHGDLADLRDIFAEGAMVWHNTDDKLTDVEATIRNLSVLRAQALEMRYTDIRREPTPTGFVQQHVLIVRNPDGHEVRDMCCCICRVENGRIAHMDAYHDSAATGTMPHHAGKARAQT